MSLTIERKKQNRMSFLGIQIICKHKSFTTSVYRRPTFSEVYTHFYSFLPSIYKFGTVYTFAYRCLRICSNWTQLCTELVCLKENLATLKIFINKCSKRFMDNIHVV